MEKARLTGECSKSNVPFSKRMGTKRCQARGEYCYVVNLRFSKPTECLSTKKLPIRTCLKRIFRRRTARGARVEFEPADKSTNGNESQTQSADMQNGIFGGPTATPLETVVSNGSHIIQLNN